MRVCVCWGGGGGGLGGGGGGAGGRRCGAGAGRPLGWRRGGGGGGGGGGAAPPPLSTDGKADSPLIAHTYACTASRHSHLVSPNTYKHTHTHFPFSKRHHFRR